MFTTLLIQTATIEKRTATGFDIYGNEQTSFSGSGDEQVNVRCRIYEKTGSEDTDERETITRTAVGFFEPTADIGPYDRVSIDGTIWEVRGNPRVLLDTRTEHHIEVILEEIIP